MDDLGRELDRIGVAQRVDLPDHAAHARELHAHRLEARLAAFDETFLARGDLLADVFVGLDEEAGVFPMAVREDHRRRLAGHVLRTIEVTRHEEARGAFEIDLLDRVFTLVDLPVDDRVERRLGRHRPEALRDQQLSADELASWLPCLDGLRSREGEISVQVLQRTEPGIFSLSERQGAKGREGKRGEAHGGRRNMSPHFR
jgi:hypothetical protein